MVEHDVGFEGGTVVTAQGRRRAHVYVRDGRVSALSHDRLPAATTVDATGLHVLPGMVDTHVHLMDPGPTDREDFPTGTAAAAARGVTTIVEHTHGHPVREPADLREKRAHLRERANVDYALAAHVWPDRLDGLAELWRDGVTFFKIFTCTTHGVPGLDTAALLSAFSRLEAFGGTALVHCEDERLTAEAERLLRAAGRDDPGVVLEWRSREAELVAVGVVSLLVELTGARASIAHVSSPDAARIVSRARAAGAPLAAEVCPQYLLLREPEIHEHGAFRKFTPPARARSDADEAAMWELLRTGVFTHLSTDHAPATAEQKRDGSIWDVHFGLPGLDTTFPLLLDAAIAGRLSLEDVVRVYSEAPARWYGLHPRKGSLRPGADADVVLVALDGPGRELRDRDVRSKAGWTPYAGRTVRGRLVGTWLRGVEVARDGEPFDARTGRFVPGPGAVADAG